MHEPSHFARARRSLARVALGSALATVVACGPSDIPSDLGEYREDQVPLAESPALAHIAAAIDGGDALTLEQLLSGDTPAFARAPDPSGLFALQREEHDGLPAPEDALGLRVLTYNVGLLSRWYPLTVVEVAEVEARRERFAELLLADSWDILLLQEVWEEQDVARLEEGAARLGYELYAGSERRHEAHGLAILVRSALIDADAPQTREEHIYEQQRGLERFPGPGFERGFLVWSLTLAGHDVALRLYSTHLTALLSQQRVRVAQARELGLHTRRASPDELVLVGGDLNAAPYYPADGFGVKDGEPVTGWWPNTIMYGALIHYGNFRDVQLLAGATDDIDALDGLPAFDAEAYAREPLGDAARCDELQARLTASDCNSLYFTKNAASEYPARIDYLLYRDARERVRVVNAALEYRAPVELGGGVVAELSDHSGVGAVLAIAAG